ncbi:MAG: hydrogenase nickel incorporation protein HypB [Deferribacterales bacterium]|jgi:hydrogenase nickel incorporation protein HypB
MGKVEVEKKILTKNEQKAAEMRKIFAEKGICVLNIMSSPGSGKTTILENILVTLKDKYKIAVIEGDQQTTNDADRIEATGVKAFQVNTGNGCHLEAADIERGMNALGYDYDLVIVENVGNLVCPAEFDLGEDGKITVLSTTEGEDKPIKYPVMIRASEAFIVNKTDLLPYVDFDIEKCINYAKGINAGLDVFKVSCKTKEGLEDIMAYIEKRIKAKKG